MEVLQDLFYVLLYVLFYLWLLLHMHQIRSRSSDSEDMEVKEWRVKGGVMLMRTGLEEFSPQIFDKVYTLLTVDINLLLFDI